MSLPAAAGTADLLSVLPPQLSATYAAPEHLLRPLDQVRPASRVFMCSRTEYAALVSRMLERGMLHFTSSPRVVNGLFAVEKGEGMQRLIIDARPVNALMVDSPYVDLPSPDLITNFSVPAGSTLYAAKVDLDNFYHRLRLPPAWWPYFALPPVRAGDFALPGFPPDSLVWPCCTTLPMGFSHSVFLAQAAHEFIIDSRTSLRAVDRVTRRGDFRLDRMRHSVYIDDTHWLCLDDPSIIQRALDEYCAVMADANLPAKPSKVVAPTASGVECLGLWVDGERGDIGLAAPKLQRLILGTRRLLDLGYATGRQVARLVGSWTWAMLVRRPALAIFSAVYRFAAVAGRRRFRLWPSVVRELSVAVGVAPLLHFSLRSPWFPHVVAVDASEIGQGVVAVPHSSPASVIRLPCRPFLSG